MKIPVNSKNQISLKNIDKKKYDLILFNSPKIIIFVQTIVLN
jgi:hypothetical protein